MICSARAPSSCAISSLREKSLRWSFSLRVSRGWEEVEPKLNAFVTVTEDVAHAAARKAEKAILDNDPPGLLHGVPISIKDLIAMDGIRCTFGSRLAADNVAAVDAPAVERVRKEGGVIIGKTTTSEFGCKAVGDSPLTGITRNPWDLSKTPGGSSAGAAASVAGGVSPFALGTDGGGSVRIPGSLTGLFAVKAQFARVPVFPEAATPTLAHVGPMARSVRDAALLLSAVAGSTGATRSRSPRRCRISWPRATSR